jgi:hypothetical protein
MKGCFVLILVFLGMLGTPFIGSGLESQDVIEREPTGQINWTLGTVSAKGKALPDENETDKSQALQAAVTAAGQDARKNLVQLIKGIRIDSNIKVGDILVASETIKSKLNEILDALKPIVPISYLPDGSVEVKLQMTLKGAFAQLVLPADIKQIKPIKQVNPAKSDSKSNTSGKSKATASAPIRSKPILHTGMIVDAKGLSEVKPAIVPKIIDESGQEIYGPAFVSREYALQAGMSGYTHTLASAKTDPRIKDNPLIVKGLKTKNLERSVIVVSNSDAAKLRQASEHLSFLRKCSVIIVLD